MIKPEHVIEIFLHPGEFYLGDRNTRIRTILGSCVAITMWHPKLLLGGMCHYMLPTRGVGRIRNLDGRYADEAILLFFQEAVRAGTNPGEYEIKLFGGGDMFPEIKARHSGRMSGASTQHCADVPCRNVLVARMMAEQYGFRIVAEHLGGAGHRQVLFDVWSGHAWLRGDAMTTKRKEVAL